MPACAATPRNSAAMAFRGGAVERHRVEMGAEGDGRALSAPRQAHDEVAAVAAGERGARVLEGLEADAADEVLDGVGHLPLLQRGRADAGQAHEEVAELV